VTDQLNFFGEATPTDRLFFGVFPPEDVAEGLDVLARDLREKNGLKGKAHAKGRFHVTLHHLGDWAGLPKDVLNGARQAAAAVRFAPFEVTFDRAASFEGRPKNRPFVLQGGEGVAAIKAMRQALSTELAKAGQGRVAATQFTPHVTLLYDDKLVAEQPIEPVSWTVTEFVLVHSHLGQTRHDHIGSWPLT
jgi:2'-5' RNA ligase